MKKGDYNVVCYVLRQRRHRLSWECLGVKFNLGCVTGGSLEEETLKVSARP